MKKVATGSNYVYARKYCVAICSVVGNVRTNLFDENHTL